MASLFTYSVSILNIFSSNGILWSSFTALPYKPIRPADNQYTTVIFQFRQRVLYTLREANSQPRGKSFLLKRTAGSVEENCRSIILTHTAKPLWYHHSLSCARFSPTVSWLDYKYIYKKKCAGFNEIRNTTAGKRLFFFFALYRSLFRRCVDESTQRTRPILLIEPNGLGLSGRKYPSTILPQITNIWNHFKSYPFQCVGIGHKMIISILPIQVITFGLVGFPKAYEQKK